MHRRPPSQPLCFRPTPARANVYRTLVLVVALAFGAATAQAPRSVDALTVAAAASDPVLVRLGSTRERVSFVLQRFEIAVRGVASSQGTPFEAALYEQLYGFLPTFLDQRATELVLIAQARSRGIAVEEQEIDAIIERVKENVGGEAAFERTLTNAGFGDETQLRSVVRETELVKRALAAIRAGIVVGPEEVTIAYHAQRLRFTTPAEACSRHILVDDEEHARDLLAALAAGADFGDVARAHSTDSGSAVRGGELGCLRQGLTVPEFDEATFGAEIGALLGPVETRFGHHLIQVYEIRPARVLALDAVRADLELELLEERADITLAAIVAASGVQVFPQFIPPLKDEIDAAAGI